MQTHQIQLANDNRQQHHNNPIGQPVLVGNHIDDNKVVDQQYESNLIDDDNKNSGNVVRNDDSEFVDDTRGQQLDDEESAHA